MSICFRTQLISFNSNKGIKFYDIFPFYLKKKNNLYKCFKNYIFIVMYKNISNWILSAEYLKLFK